MVNFLIPRNINRYQTAISFLKIFHHYFNSFGGLSLRPLTENYMQTNIKLVCKCNNLLF